VIFMLIGAVTMSTNCALIKELSIQTNGMATVW